MSAKNILLINDYPGYGKVALAAMTPILSRMGHHVLALPTAVVSNTLDYGRFRIQELTDYMKDTLKVWDELGFDPDVVCTGFITSEEQADIIREYLEGRSQDRKPLVVTDPIMGDGGRLYNGVGRERIEAMRRLAGISDVLFPNITEASFLTGIRPGMERGTRAELQELTDGLRKLSGKSAAITSAEDSGTGVHLICGYDHWQGKYFEVTFDYIPVRVAGSGDIFSAVVTGGLLAGKSLEETVRGAALVLTRLIAENRGNLNTYKGINIEQYWEIFDEAYAVR